MNKECEKTEHELNDVSFKFLLNFFNKFFFCKVGNLIKSKTEEMENFKKLLHEKEKFIDSYNTIKEMLVDFYNGQVLQAK